MAFTGVCTAELCDVTAGLGQYKDLNAEVIGISVDSPFSQEIWAQKENIGITLASDLNKSTSEAYGVLSDKDKRKKYESGQMEYDGDQGAQYYDMDEEMGNGMGGMEWVGKSGWADQGKESAHFTPLLYLPCNSRKWA